MSNADQLEKIKNAPGFIAALDQSGGSTPKALGLYGVTPDAWSNDEEMFDVVHAMRTRIMTSPSFGGNRILGAILFENTMDRQVEGQSTAGYLWNVKNVVPFLKVDKGLADVVDGAQVMKPMPDLDALLSKAVAAGIFGTKMRSVIKEANEAGVKAVVAQQFEIGRQIVAAGLVPIIEPEVDINCEDKAAAVRDLVRDFGAGGGHATRRNHPASGRSQCRRDRHAEADVARKRRPVCRLRRACECCSRGCAVRRLFPRGGE